MTRIPIETVNRAGEALYDACLTRGYVMGTVASAGIAEHVLEQLVVDAPVVVDQADGQLRLDWPNGFDPTRDPTQGVQYVLIDARLLARVVEVLNAARAAAASADA